MSELLGLLLPQPASTPPASDAATTSASAVAFGAVLTEPTIHLFCSPLVS